MKILVDTSLWIHAFRYKNSFEASILETLLRENVVVTSSLVLSELFIGSRSKQEIAFLIDEFSVVPVLTGLDGLGIEVGKLGFLLRKRGYLIPIVDLSLTMLAIKHNAHVYTLDKHFSWISKCSPLILFEPSRH